MHRYEPIPVSFYFYFYNEFVKLNCLSNNNNKKKNKYFIRYKKACKKV